MKKLLFIAFFIIAFIHDVNAQTPGFMGKKVIAYTSFSTNSPGLSFLLNNPFTPYNATSKEKVGRAFLPTYKLGMEYVVSRKNAIGVDYFFQRGGFKADTDYDFFQEDLPYNRNFFRNSIGIFLKSYRVQLNGRRSDMGSLAPIGRYVKYKLFVSREHLVISGTDEYFSNTDKVLGERNFHHAGISISAGRNFVIFNNILFDFGAEFGFVMYNSNKDLQRDLYQQLLSYHLFNFHVGIGVPLF